MNELLMTDSVSQIFQTEPYDKECWIQFQVIDLTEIEFPANTNDVITIWYSNPILGEAIYFVSSSMREKVEEEIIRFNLTYEVIDTPDSYFYRFN